MAQPAAHGFHTTPVTALLGIVLMAAPHTVGGEPLTNTQEAGSGLHYTIDCTTFNPLPGVKGNSCEQYGTAAEWAPILTRPLPDWCT